MQLEVGGGGAGIPGLPGGSQPPFTQTHPAPGDMVGQLELGGVGVPPEGGSQPPLTQVQPAPGEIVVHPPVELDGGSQPPFTQVQPGPGEIVGQPDDGGFVGSLGGRQPPFTQTQPGPGWIVGQPPLGGGLLGGGLLGGGAPPSKDPAGPPANANDVAINDPIEPKFGPLNTTLKFLAVRLAAMRGCRVGRALESVFSPLNGNPRAFSSSPNTVSLSRFAPTITKVPLTGL